MILLLPSLPSLPLLLSPSPTLLLLPQSALYGGVMNAGPSGQGGEGEASSCQGPARQKTLGGISSPVRDWVRRRSRKGVRGKRWRGRRRRIKRRRRALGIGGVPHNTCVSLERKHYGQFTHRERLEKEEEEEEKEGDT